VEWGLEQATTTTNSTRSNETNETNGTRELAKGDNREKQRMPTAYGLVVAAAGLLVVLILCLFYSRRKWIWK
jgi:hypothetical protein